MLTNSSTVSCLTSFREKSRSGLSNLLTSSTIGLSLSVCTEILDEVIYIAYCLALGRDRLLERALDFLAIPLVLSFISLTIAWSAFFSGLCCIEINPDSVRFRLTTGVLLILGFCIGTGFEIARNHTNQLGSSMDSVEDYLYAKLISVVLMIVAVSVYIEIYGVSRIYNKIFDVYQFYDSWLFEVCAIDGECCFFSTATDRRQAPLLDRSNHENGDQDPDVEGASQAENPDLTFLNETTVTNPMQRYIG